MSTEASSVATHLNSSGLLKSQALIGGKWVDAHDGRTIKVCILSSSQTQNKTKDSNKIETVLWNKPAFWPLDCYLLSRTCSLLWQVYNPATGEVITDVPFMGRKETNDAIASASNAFHCKVFIYGFCDALFVFLS